MERQKLLDRQSELQLELQNREAMKIFHEKKQQQEKNAIRLIYDELDKITDQLYKH
jgi:hypothetical protein